MAIETDIYSEGSYWAWVKCSPNTSYYQSLGYAIPIRKNKWGRLATPAGTQILVRVEHLKQDSHVKVTKVCDFCGKKVKNQSNQSIQAYRIMGDGRDRCGTCGRIRSGVTRQENVVYEKSFQYKCPEKAKQAHPFLNGDLTLDKVSANSHKNYWWLCPNCKSTYDMSPNLRYASNCDCPYCSGFRVNDTNSMWTTAPETANLLWYPEDGHKYTANSSKRVDFKCPDCYHQIKQKIISNIVRQGLSCPKCSDGFSYPEKLFYNLFLQVNIDFEYQKSFYWSKVKGSKRYDFYIPSLNTIVEVHGGQHYNNGFNNLGDQVENDSIKREMALINGIDKYIVIDCRNSKLDFIKSNIINSEISMILNLELVDWIECHKYACKSFVKEVCYLWESGLNNVKLIAKTMKLSKSVIINYLKSGAELGYCNYDPMFESIKGTITGSMNAKKVISKSVIKVDSSGLNLECFDSVKDAAKSVNVRSSNITAVLKGRQKTAGGYGWIYKA